MFIIKWFPPFSVDLWFLERPVRGALWVVGGGGLLPGWRNYVHNRGGKRPW